MQRDTALEGISDGIATDVAARLIASEVEVDWIAP